MVSHAQESPSLVKATANKTLHLTAIPLRCIAAGELGRYINETKSFIRYERITILDKEGKWIELCNHYG